MKEYYVFFINDKASKNLFYQIKKYAKIEKRIHQLLLIRQSKSIFEQLTQRWWDKRQDK